MLLSVLRVGVGLGPGACVVGVVWLLEKSEAQPLKITSNAQQTMLKCPKRLYWRAKPFGPASEVSRQALLSMCVIQFP